MTTKGILPSRLVEAIRAGSIGGTVAAIEAGEDVESADIHGFRGLPLRTACFAGNIAIVRELLRCGADVNAMAGDGPGAPLRLALRGGHRDIAALLILHGALIPAGLSVDPDILEKAGQAPVAPEEIAAPMLSEGKPAAPDNSIEFVAHPVETPGKEMDPAFAVTDINVLNMELLHFDEAATRITPPLAGFWQSGQAV